MRKQSLRQAAHRYLKTDNRGSFKDKKHRTYVIHKMIHDLFLIGEIPSSWALLKKNHLEKLILLWQKNKIKEATILDYMTTIRRFLQNIQCPLTDIDNKSLGISRKRKPIKDQNIQPEVWKEINEPISRIIMGMQAEFGLTFSEAISVIPGIHIQTHGLWITREIAFNSKDRTIPVRFENQMLLLQELEYFKEKPLIQIHTYTNIRTFWHMALNEKGLSTKKTYRYLYARQLKQKLLPILGNYHTDWLIRDEMGIKSRNTLWAYLHE